MKKEEQVNQFFIETEESCYKINKALKLKFNDVQEATQFLVEIIRFWHNKHNLFCNNNIMYWKEKNGKKVKYTEMPERAWSFTYKTPSDCERCINGQEILDKIFGSRKKFNKLPFVKYNEGRQYYFSFYLLKYFAKYGKDRTVKLIKKQKEGI